MLKENDKLAIAFSGGKDSILILIFFMDNPIVKDLLVIHIDPGFGNDIDSVEEYLLRKTSTKQCLILTKITYLK